jgi:purine-nucleoside phosphorylase
LSAARTAALFFRFGVYLRNALWLNPRVTKAVAQIKKLSPLRPALGIVLGSGFNHILRELDVNARIAYSKLAGFPKTSVAGHAGELLVGKLGNTPVIILSGRAHYYEGHSMEQVTFAVRTLAACGVKDLLLTNAAGGINRKFRAGDFMLLTDHINLMGANPLRGAALPGLPRFVDLSQTYDSHLSALVTASARQSKIKLQRGVYLAVSGPSYETPAEIKAFARLGAEAVGMSTVPETIVARQCGVRVAAISCITNLAAGIGKSPLSHQEVLDTAERVKIPGARLLKTFATLYGQNKR